MNIIENIKNAFNNIVEFIKAGLGILISGLIILFIVVMWAAQLKSCFFITETKNASLEEEKIVKANLSNPKHRKVIKRLSGFTQQSNLNNYEVYFLQENDSINAASFGNGIFLIWESLSTLPDWVIDSILAHEIAHDILLHSRKKHDLDDVRNFFIEVIGIGADTKTERTLHEWSSKLILPTYSRKQELEADRKAVELLSTVGYSNPDEIYISMLQYLKDNYGEHGGGFFDTHPSFNERIVNISNKK